LTPETIQSIVESPEPSAGSIIRPLTCSVLLSETPAELLLPVAASVWRAAYPSSIAISVCAIRVRSISILRTITILGPPILIKTILLNTILSGTIAELLGSRAVLSIAERFVLSGAVSKPPLAGAPILISAHARLTHGALKWNEGASNSSPASGARLLCKGYRGTKNDEQRGNK